MSRERKIAIISVLLVPEAESESDEELEDEIWSELEDTAIPWSEGVIKVTVLTVS